MTLEDNILSLIPVLFGWLLGVGTTGIPRLYKWLNAKKIRRKYSPLINQIMDIGVYPLGYMLTPSAIEKKAKEGYPTGRLNEKDQKEVVPKLQNCVLYDKDWETFERIVKYLEKKWERRNIKPK